MENAFYNMGLQQFKELFADAQQSSMGDDFCIVDVRYDDQLHRYQIPARLDAYMFIFCFGGSVRFNVNMKEFSLKKDQMILLVPGCIGYLVDYDKGRKEDIHYVIVGLSRRYLSILNLDLNRLYSEGKTLMDIPRVDLNEEELFLASRFLSLTKTLLASQVDNKRSCIASLIAAIFYLAEGIYNQHLEEARQTFVPQSSRADDIFKKFIRLVADYHMQERCVGFYAERLSLSPKYLSKMIKTASGCSAPEWIDSYVILEAKNFLKYSNMSIKEIVFRLHFSDQPTFTKFFKSHTGMTPAQFRKS